MQDRRDQIVILLFTLVQIALIFVLGYTPYPDSEGYLALARESLAQHQLYPIASQLHDYAFLWNLGSINLVLASLWLTGSIMPLLVVYALMKGATAWLLYDTCLHLLQKHSSATTSQRIARLVLLLYILYPANYGEATSLLSEVPFIFLSMLAVWMFITKGWHVAAGVVLAIANWIRPFSIVFLAALIVASLFHLRKSLKLVAGYIVMIVIIGSLSYLRTGEFLYQAKTGWMALMQYSWDNDSDKGTFTLNPSTICNDTKLSVTQKDRMWRSMFFSWLSENKAEYLSQMPHKLAATFVSDNVNFCAFLPHKQQREYMYDELSMLTLKAQFPRWSAVQWLTIVNLLYYYLLLLTALLSLLCYRHSTHLLPLAVILLGTVMLLLVGHGEARFHQPFMPFVIMLSALFINRIRHHD